jgi:hypothetical protein
LAISALIAKLVPKNTKPAPPGEAERRMLSVMFVDLVGSTVLDPEDMRVILPDITATAQR